MIERKSKYYIVGTPSLNDDMECSCCKVAIEISDKQKSKILDISLKGEDSSIGFLCFICWIMTGLAVNERITNIDVNDISSSKEKIH